MTPIGPCEVTIASTTDGTRVVVPGGFGGDGGGYSGSTWMPDESHLLSPDGSDGWLIGDADGSDLVPLAGDSAQAVWIGGGHGYDRPVDLSPDGAQVAYAWGPSVGLRTIALDLWVMSIDGTDRHALTSFEPGAELRAVAWSPDGTRIAFVKGLPGPESGCCPSNYRRMGPNELWLIDPDGSLRRISLPSELDAPSLSGTVPLRWSPDGSRLAIEAAGGPFRQGARRPRSTRSSSRSTGPRRPSSRTPGGRSGRATVGPSPSCTRRARMFAAKPIRPRRPRSTSSASTAPIATR